MLHFNSRCCLCASKLATVANRDGKRLRFRQSERIFWVWLYRLWPACLQTLAIFKPDTLIRWHRQGFRLYWTWISHRRRGGRASIDPEVRELIRTMSRNNIGWGAPRIHGELQMLGIQVSEATVRQIHDPSPQSAFPNLAVVPGKPCLGIDLHRLLHRTNGNIPDLICLCRAET